MAGQSSAMMGWSWTDVSVLGSQVFGQALMDSCVTYIISVILKRKIISLLYTEGTTYPILGAKMSKRHLAFETDI